MSMFGKVVDVSGTAAYPTNPQVVIPFQPTAITLIDEDTTDDAYVSFDGVNDHVHLIGGTGPGAKVTLHQRTQNVWLKKGGTSTAPTNIQVIAEA